jgi:glycosyltransferase involved in cell wall biosynthesis
MQLKETASLQSCACADKAGVVETGRNPGRDPVHVLVVSNHWKKENNVTFAGIWADRQISALQDIGVRVSTFDIGTSHSPLRLRRKWRELREAVRDSRPDIVHARYGTLVAVLSVCSGVPAVITFAGSDLLPGAGISRLRTYLGICLSNLAALRARKIICVSNQLRQALWWRRKVAVVIPDGVNLAAFCPEPREVARRRLGWPIEPEVVLLDALRDPINKGLDIAREAMVIVRKKRPQAELRVISGVSPHEMPAYYNAADVLLCASRQEGSPNVVKEALACNLPVVSTRVGDVADRLAGVEPSRLVQREPHQIARALVDILSQRRRSNGRQKVLALNLEDAARRVLEVYRAVQEALPRASHADFPSLRMPTAKEGDRSAVC